MRVTGDRIGRTLRALRHRRDWTQAQLGARGKCSASVVSRLEGGNVRACSLATLELLVEALGGRLTLRVDWRGGELDRLLDADHSLLQERWAALKARSVRWESRPEVTYSEFGERGSIDDLAVDARTGTLVVSELKTGIYDLQRTLAKLDEKVRLAPTIGRRLGWDARRVVAALIVSDTRTNRRRVAEHGALCCRGSRAEVVPRSAGWRIRHLGSKGSFSSSRCQICLGRTVGELGGSESGIP